VSTLPPRLTALSRALVLLSMIVIFSGTIVTGAGPHSGSRDDEPIERLPFAVHNVVRVHGIAMVVFLATTVLFAFLVRPGTRHASAVVAEHTRRELTVVLTVLVAQAAIGYIQYFSDVPPLLVGIHVAGATTLWITVVLFHLRRFATDPVPATPSAHELVPDRSVAPVPETLAGSASHRVRSAPSRRVRSAPSRRVRSAPGVANPPAAPET
jgi:cytochrome c oxidase assembly protein subunit 15